jgi:hypothetical protein
MGLERRALRRRLAESLLCEGASGASRLVFATRFDPTPALPLRRNGTRGAYPAQALWTIGVCLVLDGDAASTVSLAIALAMPPFGGFALGRYAGFGSWKSGFMVVAEGPTLVGAVMALSGCGTRHMMSPPSRPRLAPRPRTELTSWAFAVPPIQR